MSGPWCQTPVGCGLTPKLKKASLTQTAPAPAPGRAQRWLCSYGVWKTRCLPDRRVFFGAAVRAPKATPGGHYGNDGPRGGPDNRLWNGGLH